LKNFDFVGTAPRFCVITQCELTRHYQRAALGRKDQNGQLARPDRQTDAGKPDGCPVAVTLSAERCRLLRMLARCPSGCTEVLLMAYSFSIKFLADLVFDGSRPRN
jgi:hypothetical protein